MCMLDFYLVGKEGQGVVLAPVFVLALLPGIGFIGETVKHPHICVSSGIDGLLEMSASAVVIPLITGGGFLEETC